MEKNFPHRPLRIYGASKLSHAKMWRNLAANEEYRALIQLVSRWPFLHVGQGVPDDCPAHAGLFWTHDFEDVRAADMVVCYGEPDDVLRGALVEAGMALGMGKQVAVVGLCPGFGTWQYHPQVVRFPNFYSFFSFVRLMRVPEKLTLAEIESYQETEPHRAVYGGGFDGKL